MRDSSEALLRFYGREPDSRAVPAEVLAKSVLGVQQTVLLLAASRSKHVVRERFRPGAQLREQATVLCASPRNGAFVLPMRLAQEQLDLEFGTAKTGLWGALHAVFHSVQSGNSTSLIDIVPDSTIREKTLREVRRFTPGPGAPWSIGFTAQGKVEARLDYRAAHVIDEWIESGTEQDATMTVTGDLSRVFFEEKKIVIKYRPKNRSLNCFYREDLEDEILAMRKVPIQVTGRFILDEEGHPVELTDVYRIAPVDTAPMEFTSVRHGGRAFIFNDPFKLDIGMDEETGQLYTASDEATGIHVFAQTREQLAGELAEQIAFAWDEYATCDPSRLTVGAQRVREALSKLVREVQDVE
jgi:hypothetical protein